jgi:hypothetical protein
MSEAPTTGPCPFCGTPVQRSAAVCRSCGESLEPDDDDQDRPSARWEGGADDVLPWLIPSGRSGWAIASGYLGLLALFPLVGLVFGPAAVVTGVVALRQCRRDARRKGRGRAVFGIVTGVIGTLVYAALLLALLGGMLFFG